MIPVCRLARNWRAYLAGGGLVVAFLLKIARYPKARDSWGGSQNTEEDHCESEKEEDESADNTHICSVLIDIKDVLSKYNRRADKQHAEEQSRQSWDRAEVLGLWAAAAAGVVAIIVGSSDASDQRLLMQGQLDEMGQEARPWVSLRPNNGVAVVDPLTFDEKLGASLTLGYAIRNTGKNPAFHERISAEIVSLPMQDSVDVEIKKEADRFCTSLKDQGNPLEDNVVFPGDVIEGQLPVYFSSEQVRQALKIKSTGPFAHAGFVSLTLILCATYQTPNNVRPTYFRTRYAYLLGVPLTFGEIMGDLKPDPGPRPDVRLVVFGQAAD